MFFGRTQMAFNSEQEREHLVVILKNRYLVQHPLAHRFRKWPIIGRFYLMARARYIKRETLLYENTIFRK
jgi:hypothetical protein